jgi:hypothetical protein
VCYDDRSTAAAISARPGTTSRRRIIMAKRSSSATQGSQLHRAGSEALESAQAEQAGARFEWHFGRVTRMGYHEAAGGRGVVVVWEEGGVTSQYGSLTDDQWEIFKLAFKTTGRVAVLSDQADEGWMYDYRVIEAVR